MFILIKPSLKIHKAETKNFLKNYKMQKNYCSGLYKPKKEVLQEFKPVLCFR